MQKSVIHSDPEILSGTPLFVGTRVPARTLVDYLEGAHPLDEFLEDFPTVTREHAVAALEEAKDLLLAHANPARWCAMPSKAKAALRNESRWLMYRGRIHQRQSSVLLRNAVLKTVAIPQGAYAVGFGRNQKPNGNLTTRKAATPLNSARSRHKMSSRTRLRRP